MALSPNFPGPPQSECCTRWIQTNLLFERELLRSRAENLGVVLTALERATRAEFRSFLLHQGHCFADPRRDLGCRLNKAAEEIRQVQIDVWSALLQVEEVIRDEQLETRIAPPSPFSAVVQPISKEEVAEQLFTEEDIYEDLAQGKSSRSRSRSKSRSTERSQTREVHQREDASPVQVDSASSQSTDSAMRRSLQEVQEVLN